MKYYVNEDIKNTCRIFPPQGRYDYLRYDMNENPEGLPKEFVDAVLSEVTPEFLAVYPEPDRFLRKYGAYLGLSADHLMVTNGSDMAIRYLFETFGERGKEVVTAAPSFEMYWVNCRLLGLLHVPVSYEPDLTMDVGKILRAITENTRIVVLLNPNNPVGNVYSEEEVTAVIRKAASVGAVVIIDEAYHYFWPDTFLHHVTEEDNVILLRTFSKLFSIAALRLGVIVADPEIIRYVKNSRLSFDTNAVALLFGERILDHPELEKQLIREEKEGKEYLLSELQKRGYETRDCRGNFIFIRPRTDAHELTGKLREDCRILVHDYSNPLLSDKIRVSVGSRAAMERFLRPFLLLDGEGGDGL